MRRNSGLSANGSRTHILPQQRPHTRLVKRYANGSPSATVATAPRGRYVGAIRIDPRGGKGGMNAMRRILNVAASVLVLAAGGGLLALRAQPPRQMIAANVREAASLAARAID